MKGKIYPYSVLVRDVGGCEQIPTSLSKKAVMNQMLVIGAQSLTLPQKIMISAH